jgi:hypothetical protein
VPQGGGPLAVDSFEEFVETKSGEYQSCGEEELEKDHHGKENAVGT